MQFSTTKSGQQHADQVWSPDSQHLAFMQKTRTTTKIKGVFYSTYTTDVLRISASGGTATNSPATPPPIAGRSAGAKPDSSSFPLPTEWGEGIHKQIGASVKVVVLDSV